MPLSRSGIGSAISNNVQQWKASNARKGVEKDSRIGAESWLLPKGNSHRLHVGQSNGFVFPEIKIGALSELTSINSSKSFPVTMIETGEIHLVKVDENDNSIRVSITTTLSNSTLLSLTLRKLGEGKIKLEREGSKPFDRGNTNLESIGLYVWGLFMANAIVNHKLRVTNLNSVVREQSGSQVMGVGVELAQASRIALTDHPVPPERPRPPSTMDGGAPRNSTTPSTKVKTGPTNPCDGTTDNIGEFMDIGTAHDLTCTEAPDVLAIGVCGASMRITDCCEQHDKNLWCAPAFVDPVSVILHCVLTSQLLALCIIEKAYAAWDALPWSLCKVLDFVIVSINGFVDALLYDIVTAAICVGIANKPQFPLDGRNQKSCFCGGNVPTTSGGPCGRLLCKGDCFECGWECEYNDKKQAIARRWVTDPSGNRPCCINTARQCTSDCDPTEVSKCPNCWKCTYGPCTFDRNTRTWSRETLTRYGLPCCPGTPSGPPCGHSPRGGRHR